MPLSSSESGLNPSAVDGDETQLIRDEDTGPHYTNLITRLI